MVLDLRVDWFWQTKLTVWILHFTESSRRKFKKILKNHISETILENSLKQSIILGKLKIPRKSIKQIQNVFYKQSVFTLEI